MSLDSSASLRIDDGKKTGNPGGHDQQRTRLGHNEQVLRPARRWRVIALSCLGLLFGPIAILALLGIPVAILAAGIWAQNTVVQIVGLAILALNGFAACTLARVLQSETPVPDGLVLTSGQAPELVRLIEDVRQRLSAPGIDQVVLTEQLNATVAQSPRLFGLAGHRHTLTLGLPLLQAMSANEFAVVVAHEIAHLRRSDGKLNTLVFRVRQLWSRLAAVAEQRTFPGCTVIIAFAAWYRPLFDRVSRDVLRANEFQADAAAASIAGKTQTVAALARAAVAQAYLDALWSRFWLTNVHQAEPQVGPWASIGDKLPAAAQWDQAGTVLERALNNNAATLHSHPGLVERLNCLTGSATGVRLDEDAPVTHNAARLLLGDFYPAVIQHFDRTWWSANHDRWQTFYARVDDQTARLKALDQAALADGLSIDTALERTTRADYLLGSKAAGDRYMWCLARYPYEAAGYYAFGVFLLEQSDDRGIHHLLHAMSLDETSIPEITNRVASYLEGQGEERRAQIYRRKEEIWSAGQPEDDHPLLQLQRPGTLRAVDLARGVQEKLQDTLHQADGITAAWLVRTPLQPWFDAARTFLVVEFGVPGPIAWSGKRWATLQAQLSPLLDAECLELSRLSPEMQQIVRNIDHARTVSRQPVATGRQSRK